MFGLEHLANCHGEIALLLSLLAMLPFLGPWIKSKLIKGEDPENERHHLQ